MAKRIDTVKGLFGQLIHYEDGRYVGESWPGMFKGSYDHYDANGRYSGYSDPGLFADQVHHNVNGRYVGETYNDPFGQKTHYNIHGYAGSSHEDLFGNDISIFDEFDT